MKKRILPKLIAGTLIGATLALPQVHAGESKEAHRTSLEQLSEQTQVAIKDAWLDGKLETALLFNEHLNSFNIDTEVRNGTVYLTGAVESDIDRDLAGQIAQSIDGINRVNNRLVVDRDKAKANPEGKEAKDRQGFKQLVADATLTARIKSELLVNSNTSGLAINVDSRNGQVVLSGEVDSEQEKELAEMIARNASGARSVRNRLTVESDS